MSLISIAPPRSIDDMHAIGPVTQLGSEILSGECSAYALSTFGGPTDPISAGYFAVTPGSFRMIYPFNEQAVVVQGNVTLTDVQTGTATHYGVGDSWFVTKGTEVLWEVSGSVFIKHFFAVVD
ncbi:putative cupin superfamily protein [Variovorax boronicumulans]|jgi:uncharacterized cupin superfamily protein|uniref:Cupin superfamily protein n=1 Tax=Variovorax boronicumulans TaxID=436515 RepID=A0AAW8DTD1_9BURK|nr:cupin domain-containing protein [Variovorax boronicumulans]MDP9877443.1 putative cupin superfamily protein [Variovorax boronicumulans]MDP9922728.1 putative cupin superfamily protein [Variovorax boronicumulans]